MNESVLITTHKTLIKNSLYLSKKHQHQLFIHFLVSKSVNFQCKCQKNVLSSSISINSSFYKKTHDICLKFVCTLYTSTSHYLPVGSLEALNSYLWLRAQCEALIACSRQEILFSGRVGALFRYSIRQMKPSWFVLMVMACSVCFWRIVSACLETSFSVSKVEANSFLQW